MQLQDKQVIDILKIQGSKPTATLKHKPEINI